MKRLLALAISLVSLTGCDINPVESYCHYNAHGDYHCHESHTYSHHSHDGPTTTIVTTSANYGGGDNNNIIVIEEEPSYCSWDYPYPYDPEYCSFDGITCCMWLDIGAEETWCYTYYCGWELQAVYTYWQQEKQRKDLTILFLPALNKACLRPPPSPPEYKYHLDWASLSVV